MWHFGRGSELLDPVQLLERVGTRPGWHVADMGCGSVGHFVFPASRIVGGQGKVYAVDIQRSALQSIDRQARYARVWNIHPIWADLEQPSSTGIPSESADLTILSNTLYLATQHQRMLEEVMRVTRPGSFILIIEWKKEPGTLGPDFASRLSSEDVLTHLGAHPVRWVDSFEAGIHHHGFLVQKDDAQIDPTILSVSNPFPEASY